MSVVDLRQAYGSDETKTKKILSQNELQLLGEIYTPLPVTGHAVAVAYTQIRFRLAQRQTLHL